LGDIRYLKGTFRFIFADGTEEIYKSVAVYHTPAPHTANVEEHTRLLKFSPQHEHGELVEHVSRVMQQQAGG
jgi:hypothetical protein